MTTTEKPTHPALADLEQQARLVRALLRILQRYPFDEQAKALRRILNAIEPEGGK